MLILGPVGIVAAALGGLLTGGLGVLRARKEAATQNALAQSAQQDQMQKFQDMITQNSAANARLADQQAADIQTAQASTAPARDTVGNPNAIALALKYGGLNTVSTSLSGDTSTANTAKRRLLSK